jgi:hypothetical protein
VRWGDICRYCLGEHESVSMHLSEVEVQEYVKVSKSSIAKVINFRFKQFFDWKRLIISIIIFLLLIF